MKKIFSFFVLFLIGIACSAQTRYTITVVDTSDEPIPGANIIVKGTTTGTVTDDNGKATILTGIPNPVFVVSYIGFKTKEAASNGKTSIKVTLEENEEVLSSNFPYIMSWLVSPPYSYIERPREHMG